MPLQPSPSAERTIQIVRFLAEHPGETFSVSDLARRVGQNRATCQAVMLALEAANWVQRRDGGGYTLGVGLISVGAAAQRGTGVIELLRSAAQDLYLATGCEVIACLPTGTHMIAVARAGPSDPFSVATNIGQAFSIEPPVGLSYAAWDDNELDRWMDRAPQLSVVERTRLTEAAALVRQLGYSVTLDPATRRALDGSVGSLAEADRAEVLAALAHDDYAAIDATRRNVRVSNVSAPVFGPDNRITALIGLTLGPDDSFHLRDQAALLCAAARRLGDHLEAATDTSPVNSRPHLTKSQR